MKKIIKLLESFIKFLLGMTIFFILIFSVMSMILRWSEQTNMWLDPLTRHLVFLAVFLGAAIAVGPEKHLRLDILTPVLKKKLSLRWQYFIQFFVLLITAIVSFILTYAGYLFWLSEKSFPQEAFLHLSNYHLVFIIPFGMMLISLQFLAQSILHLEYAWRGVKPSDSETSKAV